MTRTRYGTCGRCGCLSALDALRRIRQHRSAENPNIRCAGEGHRPLEDSAPLAALGRTS